MGILTQVSTNLAHLKTEILKLSWVAAIVKQLNDWQTHSYVALNVEQLQFRIARLRENIL